MGQIHSESLLKISDRGLHRTMSRWWTKTKLRNVIILTPSRVRHFMKLWDSPFTDQVDNWLVGQKASDGRYMYQLGQNGSCGCAALVRSQMWSQKSMAWGLAQKLQRVAFTQNSSQ